MVPKKLNWTHTLETWQIGGPVLIHLYNKRCSSLHSCGHTCRKEGMGMQVWLKQHIPLIFPFLLMLAPFNVTGGHVLSMLQISTHIHLNLAHFCPARREARCSAHRHTPLLGGMYAARLAAKKAHLHLTEIITNNIHCFFYFLSFHSELKS